MVEIPYDILAVEILPRVLANELHNFKSVCKDWLKLISSPQFVRFHLERCDQSPSRIRILVLLRSDIIEYNNYYEETTRIPYLAGFSGKSTKIVGSCDGLVCLIDQDKSLKIAVINPSTGKCFGLEEAANHRTVLGFWFGHHPSSVGGEFFLVLETLTPLSRREVRVYKSTGNSKLKLIHSTSYINDPWWLRLSYAPLEYPQERGTLLHGALHWPAQWVHDSDSRYLISAYHLDENLHFEISPPAQCDFTLGLADGCLFAILKPPPTIGEEVHMHMFELWIMREYGIEESWTKYANIEGFDGCRILSPLGFFPNGDLVLDVDRSKLMKYNFNDNESLLLTHFKSDERVRSEAIMCADSLLSPEHLFGGVD